MIGIYALLHIALSYADGATWSNIETSDSVRPGFKLVDKEMFIMVVSRSAKPQNATAVAVGQAVTSQVIHETLSVA